MSNMSYCRFHNTFLDLEDCYDNINEKLSLSEHEERIELIKLCRDIVEDFKDYTDNELEELPHEDY